MLDIYPWYDVEEYKGWKLFIQSGMLCFFGEALRGDEKIFGFDEEEEGTIRRLKQLIDERETREKNFS